ncbi:MAG: DNA repair protein RadA [Cyclobacteriaceae bacterium]
MAKQKSVYFCQNCGYESAKWLGKCPSCEQWNTFAEEIVSKTDSKNEWRQEPQHRSAKPTPLGELSALPERRISTGDQELDRTLGGGMVPGSLILIGGEPGIGKSTLMLQLALTQNGKKTLYVSGEESDQQIKMRADRLPLPANPSTWLLTETNTRNIFSAATEVKPSVMVIDSIQTLYSPVLDGVAGSVGQVRQCAAELLKFAKETGTIVFLVGHITKDGMLAGPKVLEHMVDTVLQFEGDRHLSYRILRTTKNRFGSTAEIGIYEMLGSGLRQVSNPSEILISPKDAPLTGVTIGATIEGNRPLLIEVQSLVSPASYGTPQRNPNGFDHKRLNMMLAVLEKRCGFRMGMQDVFLNMAGGLYVEDPAIDLAVCMAMVSSLEEIPISDKICFAAEVGLGGELRPVNKVDQRISEAEKLGFKEIYISKFQQAQVPDRFKIKVHAEGKLEDVLKSFLK